MTTVDVTPDERDLAIRSLRHKRGFKSQLFSYVVINVSLWGVWLATGGAAEQGYWPAWVTVGWGIGVLFSAWDAYHVEPEKPFSDADIDAELRRMRR